MYLYGLFIYNIVIGNIILCFGRYYYKVYGFFGIKCIIYLKNDILKFLLFKIDKFFF